MKTKVIIVVFSLLLCFGLTACGGDNSEKSKVPDEIALMSYAQTVIDDHYPSAKYSSNKRDYTFVETNLRYKIEGSLSTDGISENQNFYMIIEFVDDSYSEYDLVSFQVGNENLR